MSTVDKVKEQITQCAQAFKKGQYIRAINYHNTHIWDKATIEAEMQCISEHFSPVTVKDLDQYFCTGLWHKEKPGIIVSVFEGYRNNYDVMLPLLEKYGMVGWFHVPVRFLDIPIMEQKKWAKDHSIGIYKHKEYPDCRFALTNHELVELDKHHVVGCHTMTHEEITDTLEEPYIQYEIVQSKTLLEQKLGHEVPFFCWLGGKDFRTNTIAETYIREAGYRYMFSNYRLQKLR